MTVLATHLVQQGACKVQRLRTEPVSDVELIAAVEQRNAERPRYLKLQRKARRLGLSLQTYRRCSVYDPAGGYTLVPKGDWVMFCEQQRLSLDEVEGLLDSESGEKS